MKLKRGFLSLVATGLILISAACSVNQPGQNGQVDNKEVVELVSVTDGDTIRVKRKSGETATVRYLLVDTPESSHPTLGKQAYSEAAKKFNEELVSNGTLELEFDKGDQTDKYDRLLAYVYVDGKSVQEALIQNGLARVGYIYPPNDSNVDKYRAVEEEVKKEKLNIWSVDGFVTDRGFNQSAMPENEQKKESIVIESIEGLIDYYLNN